MFFLAYTWSELRRRRGRTLLTAVGLGVGVGLVVAVNALSAGLDDAQDKVLEPLTGVGTDITVTRPEARSEAPRERRSRVDVDDLGKPGDKFSRTDFVEGPQLPFKAAKVADIAALDGVKDAAGSLSVNALTVTGTVPERRQEGAQVGPPPAGGGGDQAPLDGRDVNNLLDNAAQHGGGVIEVRVGEDGVVVRDHGPGIPEPDLGHVFDRFYRPAESRGRPGIGLGLAIVRQVAETHGGAARAANAPGGGAELTLALPAQVVACLAR